MAAVAALMLAVSCGSKDSFTIEGQIEGYADGPVEVAYLSTNGQFQVEQLTTDGGGRFTMTGFADNLTGVEIFRPGEGRVALVLAANGDKITLKQNPATGAVEAKGNEPSRLLAEWFTANVAPLRSHRGEVINGSIAEFIGNNPASPASVALLLMIADLRANPLGADSLRNLIDRDAFTPLLVAHGDLLQQQVSATAATVPDFIVVKVPGDTTLAWTCHDSRVTLFAFADNTNYSGRDSLARVARMSRVKVLEMFMVGDSATWARTIAADTVRWSRVWLPGMAGNRTMENFLPPQVPFYVVVDSLGTQIYRGRDIAAAVKATR